jgi:tetrapyrrole methylase family protein/MazG family protein
MKITLIGLGIEEGDLTVKAVKALKEADEIFARTSLTNSFKNLDGYNVTSLDSLFEKSRTFDTLNKKLASAVLEGAKRGNVCYCVDGGVSEDEACKIILKKHKDCTVIEGVTKGAHAVGVAKLNSTQYTSVSAYGLDGLKSCKAVVVYDIDSDYIASIVKEKLTDLFGEESKCTFIRGNVAKKIKIYEIDRQREYDYSCCVAVEEGEFLKKERYDYADLEHMIKLLRAPNGCPWDRVQTNESIKSNVIEEAYELADAIERGDDDGIEEETGDVLLQAAFHAVMKEEQGVFNGNDAITHLVKKLIFRHSHIFGKDKASNDTEALGVWDKNKKIEKNMTTFGESVMAVPTNFPACMRAQKVQKRASKSGMDFLSPISASEKLAEEVAELINAVVDEDRATIFDEAGDVLFSAVNTCRLAGVDCEEALKASIKKFSQRFVMCEKLIIEDKKDITDLNELELNWYWEKAKNALSKN